MQAQTTLLQKLADAVTDIAGSMKQFISGNVVRIITINI